VVVAVAPALFGCDPSVLPKVVDRVLGDPEAVPLLVNMERPAPFRICVDHPPR